MSRLADLLAARQAARDCAEQRDITIAQWCEVARLHRDKVPDIEVTAEQRALNATSEITVSVEWLAFMFDFLAEHDGSRSGGVS